MHPVVRQTAACRGLAVNVVNPVGHDIHVFSGFMIEQKTLELRTRGRGTTEITAEVARAVAESGIRKGLCAVFLQHTSASLVVTVMGDN